MSWDRIPASQHRSGAVLEDEEIRRGIKSCANWPTIPQLYVNGEFVGGADIVRELQQVLAPAAA